MNIKHPPKAYTHCECCSTHSWWLLEAERADCLPYKKTSPTHLEIYVPPENSVYTPRFTIIHDTYFRFRKQLYTSFLFLLHNPSDQLYRVVANGEPRYDHVYASTHGIRLEVKTLRRLKKV